MNQVASGSGSWFTSETESQGLKMPALALALGWKELGWALLQPPPPPVSAPSAAGHFSYTIRTSMESSRKLEEYCPFAGLFVEIV